MYKRLDKCVCCTNSDLFEILDLGSQPLANSFHDENEVLEEYELKLMGCNLCWHTQLSIAVDPSVLFKNYLYVSGTSQTLKDYFDQFATRYTARFEKPGMVLDIACNDGSQLDSFKERGWRTFGVDPAENLYSSSIQKGHFVINEFWTEEIADKLPNMDLIIAQNVFAHTAEPLEFLNSCKKIMNHGTLLIIQTSQADMFANNEFDTIYHEHISFFSVMSMKKLAGLAGLHLHNVYKTPIHGTSYVFELGMLPVKLTRSLVEHIKEEITRYNKGFYQRYKHNVNDSMFNLTKTLNHMRKMGRKVIGYGAAAKGMTVVNFSKIELDYIVDDNPLKQNKLCPGSNIPVYSSAKLEEESNNIVIVPLAWNFFDEIKDKVKKIRPNNKDIYIKYFPKINIER